MSKRTMSGGSRPEPAFRVLRNALAVLGAGVLLLGSVAVAAAQVSPAVVDTSLAPGAAFGVDKTVQTPEFPPALDLCLLIDLTGSFANDLTIINDNSIDEQLFDNVRAAVADSRFCIASFKDFPLPPFGISVSDYPYALDLDFVTGKAAFAGAFGALTATGGNDVPEAQYEALYQIATGEGLLTGDPELDIAPGQNPSWSLAPAVTRVVALWTDATFHTPADPGYPSPHGQAEVVSAMTTNPPGPFSPIKVVGLKQPGAGGELDALAAATGGSTVEGVDAEAIADAIVQGISNLPVKVTPVPVGCAPLDLSYTPSMTTVIGGNPALFHEVIGVPGDAPQGTTIECSVNFVSDSGEVLGTQDITVRILDVTPPQATCVEGPNPAGNVPKAGQKSKGQNEDGFYHLYAADNVDSNPDVFLMDLGSGFMFGPFAAGTNIKYTQAPGASPSQSPMSGEVDWKLKGQGDFVMWAVDDAGNTSARAACLVPPPPK